MRPAKPSNGGRRRSYGGAADRALNLWVALARCAASVSRVSARDIHRYGLTQAQFAVLEVLYHRGALPLCSIGEKLLVTSGNITYVADQLERAGYLRRQRSTEDRRVVLAHLTPKGEALLDLHFPSHAARMAEAAGTLSPREQDSLARLLKKWGKATQKNP
ncbi:MAG: MarR family transcriptional regulator [Gemmatimonadales bacterium]|nr:MarR family transcriptional regulator [Gemmatimonadales bacterium]